jgi:hypothetical protein
MESGFIPITHDGQLDPVVAWRCDQAELLGLDPVRAANFASHTEADLDMLRTLVKKGCDPKLALEIIL